MSDDTGLQAERTRLAWSRTALNATLLGAVLLHSAHSTTALVCGLVVVASAAGLLLRGIGRYRAVRDALAAGRSVVDGGIGPAGLLVVVPALAALVAVVAG